MPKPDALPLAAIERMRHDIAGAFSFISATLATVSERGDCFSFLCGDIEIDVTLRPVTRDRNGNAIL